MEEALTFKKSKRAARITPRLPDELFELVKKEGRPVKYRQGEFLYYQNSSSPVTAYVVPQDKAEELIRKNGEFALFIVHSLIHKLKAQSDQLEKIAGIKVMKRLAAILCTLDYYGIPKDKDGWFQISQTELAGIVSTTRPNMTVLLNRLAEQGLIELKRNMIRLTGEEKLEQLSLLSE